MSSGDTHKQLDDMAKHRTGGVVLKISFSPDLIVLSDIGKVMAEDQMTRVRVERVTLPVDK